MTKRTAENVLSPEVPHKRCFRSVSNKPFGGVNVIQNASLLPLDEQRCRKRPSTVEDQLDRDNLPRKVAASRVNTVTVEKNTCQSRTFEDDDDDDDGRPVTRRPSRALQPESNKQPDEQNKHSAGDKVMHSDEDLSSFNSFQFWRVPLPELDLSLLEGEPCSETMET
ncbi:uncharacterized protein wu:fa19b12 [Danio aesculapii]|uniref:uncharacterized protein wu:fa19b12 n=1 Tax=Danio aesculapii TaxID=1142201 RepID=UPI0024BFEBD9|nr:uncharacterized protein wu:fa19b12 [Danio aesculapii]XP_056313742.1 uncharacterized protein wu:fa19b12 [Danio aesculapii]